MQREEEEERYWKWLQQDDRFKLNQDLSIQDVTGELRGIYTNSEIKKNSLICSIPPEFVFCPENSQLWRLKFIKKIYDMNPLFGFTLMFQFEIARGEHSRWKEYINYIFTTFQPNRFPILWTDYELVFLDGTAINTSQLQQEKLNLQKQHSKLIKPIIRNYRLLFESPLTLSSNPLLSLYSNPQILTQFQKFKSFYSFKNFLICGLIVQSYSFTNESGHYILLPFADSLNSVPGQHNSKIFTVRGCYKIKSIKTISSGSEVLNTYGKKSNGELLLRYGYASKENKWNVVVLKQKEVEEGIKDHIKLNKEGMSKKVKEQVESRLEAWILKERGGGEEGEEEEEEEGEVIYEIGVGGKAPSQLVEDIDSILNGVTINQHEEEMEIEFEEEEDGSEEDQMDLDISDEEDNNSPKKHSKKDETESDQDDDHIEEEEEEDEEDEEGDEEGEIVENVKNCLRIIATNKIKQYRIEEHWTKEQFQHKMSNIQITQSEVDWNNYESAAVISLGERNILLRFLQRMN